MHFMFPGVSNKAGAMPHTQMPLTSNGTASNGTSSNETSIAPAIEFDRVSFSLNGRPLLENLSLAVNRGETLVLLGRSGSGKTTTLKLINGLLMPVEGEVRISGRSTAKWDPIR